MRILVVEDQYLVAAAVAEILSDAGYGTAFARSAEEALAPLEGGGRPDLAIVDLRLADGMSGPGVADRMVGDGVPVIVCSGYSRSAIMARLGGIDVAGILEKPVLPAHLLGAVRRALAPAAGGAADAEAAAAAVAFTAALLKELPHLRRFALSLARDEDRAGDLVQETVERALKHPPVALVEPGLRPWLFRVMQNLFRDQHRRQQRYMALLRRQLPQSVAVAPAQEERVRLAEVQQAMHDLSPEHAEILVSGCALELSYEEIAAAFGIPVGTVRSRISRARAALSAALGRDRLN